MVPFAVTIKLDSSAKGEKFDVKACKKGYTMAIRDAKKYGVKEGKQGFIETTVEGIKVSASGKIFHFGERDCCGENRWNFF